MIASFNHDFIFVKTRKVGGTSLEIVMSSWCSGHDIVTPIPPEDEAMRAEFGGAARNFHERGGQGPFFNHMPATDIRKTLPGLWRRSFTFAVDRHPFEKVVSRAYWNIGRRDGDAEAELDREIEAAIASRSYLNFPLYCDGDSVIVDELWRFEEMWGRLAGLAQRLGVSMPAERPRAKGGHRKDRRPAREILSADQRARIAEDAAIEFRLLGYDA